jgi:GNAT superfamily N-acetyltransferase
MDAALSLIEVTDATGAVASPRWLAQAEGVHRQLRTQLPADYAQKMRSVFAGGGRMVVAARGEAVAGVAVWRAHENTFAGLHLYVDDLVSDEAQRSRGVGHALMQWLEQRAKALGCSCVILDSGTQRTRAHAFYFREGMFITSFNFRKSLS